MNIAKSRMIAVDDTQSLEFSRLRLWSSVESLGRRKLEPRNRAP